MPTSNMIGSIFETDANVLVNPVNTVGVMGAGLAKQFKDRYPKMFKSYKGFCDHNGYENGVLFPTGVWITSEGEVVTDHHTIRLHWWTDSKTEHTIINAPTKRHYSENSDLYLVRQTINDIEVFCRFKSIDKVAIPRLGCGLGGVKVEGR